MPDAIADAQSGEAVNLRERPHQDQIGTQAAAGDFRDEIEFVFEELDVSLVERDDDVAAGRLR
jgi:hypothetical protein